MSTLFVGMDFVIGSMPLKWLKTEKYSTSCYIFQTGKYSRKHNDPMSLFSDNYEE